MKKQNIINLVGYHMEENHAAFVSEVREIAGDFKKQGETEIAEYLMDLISNPGVYIPMRAYKNFLFLEQLPYSFSPLYLPDCIKEDVMEIIQRIRSRTGGSRFLFYGEPGTGKTETVLQIGRLLKRDILQIRSKELSNPESIRNLFIEINHLRYDDVLLLFDDLDSWIFRDSLTDPAVKEIHSLTDKIPLIATTNRFDLFGPSLKECFDACISFDRYEREDLAEIADRLPQENPLLEVKLRYDHLRSKEEPVPLPEKTGASPEKIRRDLQSILDYYEGFPFLKGCLIDVHYHGLLPRPQGKTTEAIRVGSRFSDDQQGGKHLIVTYYVDKKTVRDTLKKLKETDCFQIDSLGVPNITAACEHDSLLITLFHTEIFPWQLINILKIPPHCSYSFIGMDTVLADREFYRHLRDKAPFLISMVSSEVFVPPETASEFTAKCKRTIPDPDGEPVIGVIGTPFDSQVYFSRWVESRGEPESVSQAGTEVSSIIVDGPSLNPWLDDGCGRFRVRHFGVCTDQICAFQLGEKLQSIVTGNADIHVWVLFLESKEETSENFVSWVRAELEATRNVIFVTPGTDLKTGSSLAAAWIARKLSFLIDIMSFPRETAKALLIDAAKGNGIVPIPISDILQPKNNEIRLVLYGTSTSAVTSNDEIPIPLDAENNCPYVFRTTLCYFPGCTREWGVDYPDRKLSLKFEEVKPGTWGISITSTPPSKSPLNFGVVITLREMNGVNRIRDFITACRLKGWTVQEVNPEKRLTLYRKSQREVSFD